MLGIYRKFKKRTRMLFIAFGTGYRKITLTVYCSETAVPTFHGIHELALAQTSSFQLALLMRANLVFQSTIPVPVF